MFSALNQDSVQLHMGQYCTIDITGSLFLQRKLSGELDTTAEENISHLLLPLLCLKRRKRRKEKKVPQKMASLNMR